MDQNGDKKQVELGVFAARGGGGLSRSEQIALALSVVWLLVATIFFFAAGGLGGETLSPGIRVLILLLSVVLPIAMIWVAVMAVASARIIREETMRLQGAVDALRQSMVAQRQQAGTTIPPSVEAKLDQIVAAQRQTDAALATFSSTRPLAAPLPETVPVQSAASGDPQPSLALGHEADAAPDVPMDDFITALNFPKTAEDVEGFRALRRAMRDRRASELIQASQDVLTLLSQDGIYMDDLTPDRARPEVWRRFAQGERGRPVAALGGIRDRSSITLTAKRMRQDHIFRDTVHHFLRKFDQVFAEIEKVASDAEIAAISDTRTARGFMLLGRVAGVFD